MMAAVACERTSFWMCNFLLWLLLTSVSPVLSATHWVVTEDGKIQEQVYSVFQMRRPYDLVALMQQESRAHLIENFMVQVDNEIEAINQKRNIEFNSKGAVYENDYDCVQSEKPLSNYNLYTSTISTCRLLEISLENLLKHAKRRNTHQKLDCSSAVELDFSMDVFEHLQAMRDRHALKIAEDIELNEILSDYVSDLDLFGGALREALTRNHTSWILYNLAGYYFRMDGNARHAVECIRRALHFSPKKYKSVALLNLGNVFHHARQSKDAIVVVSAAADLDPGDPMIHYTLGNIYAVLEEYDMSARSFETALKLRPDFEAAALRRHAAKCHYKMEKTLDTQFESLQQTLVELGNFQQRLDFWQRQQDRLVQEQASIENRLASQIDYAEWTIQQKINHQIYNDGASPKHSGSASDKNKDCSTMTPSGSTGQPFIANVKIQLGSTWSHLLEDVEVTAARLKQEAELNAAAGRSSDLTSNGQTTSKYPRRPHQGSLAETPARHLLPDWPSGEDCKFHEMWDGPRLTYPAFIPPENKGFKIGRILAKLKILPKDDGQPVCAVEVGAAHTSTLWDWMFANLEASKEDIMVTRNSLREYISEYSGRYSVEELGIRLKRALADRAAPEWLLYQLSSFYWAALGDIGNFSRCLVSSSVLTPPSFKDVSMVPIASIMGREGLVTGALYLSKMALQANGFEPVTNKLLADLYMQSGDLKNAAFHYRRVLQEEPDDEDALQSYLWVSCQLQKRRDENAGDESATKNLLRMNLEETNVGFRNCHISAGIKGRSYFCGGKEMEDFRDSSTGRLNRQDGNIVSLSHFPPVVLDGNLNRFPLSEDGSLPYTFLHVISDNPSEIPSPDPSECQLLPAVNFQHFTSTWLSLSAKGILLHALLDLHSPMSLPFSHPHCDPNVPPSALTLDHLTGMKNRADLMYTAETGLREALQSLGEDGRSQVSVEEMGTRLANALKQNSTSWVLPALAALYWRVTGHAEEAIICLRQSLHYAPREMQDIPLISLANIFYRAGLYYDAIVVANMALDISPRFVIIHFTLANILAARGNLDEAEKFYRSTLALQSTFEPAKERLSAIECGKFIRPEGSHHSQE